MIPSSWVVYWVFGVPLYLHIFCALGLLGLLIGTIALYDRHIMEWYSPLGDICIFLFIVLSMFGIFGFLGIDDITVQRNIDICVAGLTKVYNSEELAQITCDEADEYSGLRLK